MKNLFGKNQDKQHNPFPENFVDTGETYADLFNLAIDMDQTLDFFKLRMLYTKTDQYNPYSSSLNENRNEMLEAFGKNEHEKIIAAGKSLMQKFPIDMYAHFVLAQVNRDQNQTLAAWHLFMWNGLYRSLLNSGDGKSFETAFPVITVSEEYFFLEIMGLNSGNQSAIDQKGRSYDELIATHADAPGEKYTFYFDVTLLKARMYYMFENGLKFD